MVCRYIKIDFRRCIKKMLDIHFCFILYLIFTINLSISIAQNGDTLKFKNLKITSSDILIPGLLFSTSIIALTDNDIIGNHEFTEGRNKWFSGFHNHLDDYGQFAPVAIVYLADLFGAKAKNNFLDRSFLLLKAELFTGLFVLPMKKLTHIKRPDGSDHNSFPSGHTAQAFVAATFLHKELGDESVLYSIAGYSLATTIGLFRMANNKHWASDVLAGAAIGILATNLAYKLGQYKWIQKHKENISFQTAYSNKRVMLGFNYNF